MTEPWDVRVALAYGSQHVAFTDTREQALGEAHTRIAIKGRGEVTTIDEAGHVVYFDYDPEEG